MNMKSFARNFLLILVVAFCLTYCYSKGILWDLLDSVPFYHRLEPILSAMGILQQMHTPGGVTAEPIIRDLAKLFFVSLAWPVFAQFGRLCMGTSIGTGKVFGPIGSMLRTWVLNILAIAISIFLYASLFVEGRIQQVLPVVPVWLSYAIVCIILIGINGALFTRSGRFILFGFSFSGSLIILILGVLMNMVGTLAFSLFVVLVSCLFTSSSSVITGLCISLIFLLGITTMVGSARAR